MKLNAFISHLLFLFAGLMFMFQAHALVAQKSIDPQFGVDSQKGPPGITTADLVYKTNYSI